MDVQQPPLPRNPWRTGASSGYAHTNRTRTSLGATLVRLNQVTSITIFVNKQVGADGWSKKISATVGMRVERETKYFACVSASLTSVLANSTAARWQRMACRRHRLVAALMRACVAGLRTTWRRQEDRLPTCHGMPRYWASLPPNHPLATQKVKPYHAQIGYWMHWLLMGRMPPALGLGGYLVWGAQGLAAKQAEPTNDMATAAQITAAWILGERSIALSSRPGSAQLAGWRMQRKNNQHKIPGHLCWSWASAMMQRDRGRIKHIMTMMIIM